MMMFMKVKQSSTCVVVSFSSVFSIIRALTFVFHSPSFSCILVLTSLLTSESKACQ